MKLSSILILLAVSTLLTACSTLDNPFANWFHSGRDARVYNPQTGQYEWPAGKATPAPKKSAAVAGALASTPAPPSEGRVFDPQKNQWVEAHNADSPAPTKPEATPSPSAPAPAAAVASVPAGPRPARDSGVYNPATGKIEWQSGGASVPAPLPATASAKPVKHWWWPF